MLFARSLLIELGSLITSFLNQTKHWAIIELPRRSLSNQNSSVPGPWRHNNVLSHLMSPLHFNFMGNPLKFWVLHEFVASDFRSKRNYYQQAKVTWTNFNIETKFRRLCQWPCRRKKRERKAMTKKSKCVDLPSIKRQVEKNKYYDDHEWVKWSAFEREHDIDHPWRTWIFSLNAI